MINFTRAFDSAWERMLVILFRPFTWKKWLIIGFNVFLAYLAEGGISFNQPFHTQTQSEARIYSSVPAFLHGSKQFIYGLRSYVLSPWAALYVGLAFVFLIVWLLLLWVGCRGQFLFLDNVVRNRAAIAWPWRRYAREGNVWFVFQTCLGLVSMIIFLGLSAGFIALNWSWIDQERNPNGSEIAALVWVLLIVSSLWLVCGAILFLIRSFAVPLLFKQTFGFWGALRAVGRLMMTYPGSLIIYVLISFVLALAMAILAMLAFCLICCVVCCVALIPFIGSLLLVLLMCQILLPAFIYYRCFQLDCLAQFGPEYDVWIVDVPPSGSGASMDATPPPPPV